MFRRMKVLEKKFTFYPAYQELITIQKELMDQDWRSCTIERKACYKCQSAKSVICKFTHAGTECMCTNPDCNYECSGPNDR